jgi:hypothetical protein
MVFEKPALIEKVSGVRFQVSGESMGIVEHSNTLGIPLQAR